MSVRKVLRYTVRCNTCDRDAGYTETFDEAREVAGNRKWKVTLSGNDDCCPDCLAARAADAEKGFVS